MMEFLKNTTNGISTLEKPIDSCWVNLFNPDDNEINYISKLLKVRSDDINDFKENINSLQDMEEIPFIEKWNNFTFIIVRTPQKIEGTIEYSTLPIGVFINNNYIITISFVENQILEKIKERNFKFDTVYFLLRLLLLISRTYLLYLKAIDKKIITIQDKLEKNQRNEEIMELLDLKKSLVLFSTSLKNNGILYDRMVKHKLFIKDEVNDELLSDVIDENKQGMEMANIYSSIIKDTLNVFASIISNNLNKVVKVLTAITIVIAIPTLIASIYGMNVSLPFQLHRLAFIIVMFICVFVTSLIVWILWKKKWF